MHTAWEQICPGSSRMTSWYWQPGRGRFVLPCKGDAADDLLSVNDIEEYTAFRSSPEDAERIAIIGPGLIGCEFADELAASGRSVTVMGPDPHPISTLLPEQAGKALQLGLSEIGIEWKLGTVAESINKADRGYELTLANGDKVQADVMLSAIGLKPELTLAERIGQKTERGIVTDRFLATSQPGHLCPGRLCGGRG